MLIDMSSMLFVKHLLNKELLYMVSCFEIFFLKYGLWFVYCSQTGLNCCIYSMIMIILDIVTLYYESERAFLEKVS